MKARETKNGTVLEVFVKPNSREFNILVENEEVIVFCRESPTGGRVNRELIKQLSRFFNRRAVLVSGFASRKKELLISDIGSEELEKLLKNHS